MKIRNVTPADLDEILKIEMQCFPIQEAATKEQIAERLHYFSDCFWILESSAKMIGFINGMMTHTPDLQDEMYENASLHDKNGAWQMVFGLDVLPGYRHKGYATMLMQHLIQSAEQTGKMGVVLTCKQELVEFYQKFGFRNEGISVSEHGGAVWYQMRLTFCTKDRDRMHK